MFSFSFQIDLKYIRDFPLWAPLVLSAFSWLAGNFHTVKPKTVIK